MANVVDPVTPVLHPADAANAQALAAAGVSAPSETGGFEPPTLESLHARLERAESVLKYLRDHYFRDDSFVKLFGDLL